MIEFFERWLQLLPLRSQAVLAVGGLTGLWSAFAWARAGRRWRRGRQNVAFVEGVLAATDAQPLAVSERLCTLDATADDRDHHRLLCATMLATPLLAAVLVWGRRVDDLACIDRSLVTGVWRCATDAEASIELLGLAAEVWIPTLVCAVMAWSVSRAARRTEAALRALAALCAPPATATHRSDGFEPWRAQAAELLQRARSTQPSWMAAGLGLAALTLALGTAHVAYRTRTQLSSHFVDPVSLPPPVEEVITRAFAPLPGWGWAALGWVGVAVASVLVSQRRRRPPVETTEGLSRARLARLALLTTGSFVSLAIAVPLARENAEPHPAQACVGCRYETPASLSPLTLPAETAPDRCFGSYPGRLDLDAHGALAVNEEVFDGGDLFESELRRRWNRSLSHGVVSVYVDERAPYAAVVRMLRAGLGRVALCFQVERTIAPPTLGLWEHYAHRSGARAELVCDDGVKMRATTLRLDAFDSYVALASEAAAVRNRGEALFLSVGPCPIESEI